MNELYKIPYLDVMPLFLLHLQITAAALPRNKREMKSDEVFSKKGKATTMNKLYNIPCLDVMPQFLLLLQMTGLLPKNKREIKSD